ncbi:cytochrome b5 domain-containing protein [Candidatus Shapirobacteria bacterium]|nr:cytochrome b5 domain-containing protein [Candidatus Shapirobacteria bacterium]
MSEIIKKILLVGATLILILATVRMGRLLQKPKRVVVNNLTRIIYVEELKGYDGTVENRPIYLAYEGYVYNVTDGKEYYQPGGVYHSLAGRDATKELNIAGGSIIKRKYPIVGKLSQNILIKP